ncbi:MAG TPA: iron-sulfur cluster biosynthesis family protein [Arachidicoccus sp.]|nr:iron-sulfur cluster biosynthesis family protein [Arachidicoccus sp.]
MDIIEFTPAAIKKLQDLKQTQKDTAENYVRIGSRGGGCGVAVSYFLGFDKAEADDKILTINNIDCVIQKGQLLQLQGLKVEWLENEGQQGFQFVHRGAN